MSLVQLRRAAASAGVETCPSEPVGQSAVDLGADTGALVLMAPAGRAGREVEIEPIGDPGRRQHVFVLGRQLDESVVYAALFACLPPGDYRVLPAEGSADQVVTVSPGRVTNANWK